MFDKVFGKHEYEYLELCEKIMKYDLKVKIPDTFWMNRESVTDYVQRKNGSNSEYVSMIERANMLAPLINPKYRNVFTIMSPIHHHRDEIQMKQWIAEAKGKILHRYSFSRICTSLWMKLISIIKELWEKFSSNNNLMLLSVGVIAMFIMFKYFPSFYNEMKPIINDLIGAINKE